MDLAQQISSKFGGKKSHDDYDEETLIYIHHLLMKEYGWIPLEEFKKLPHPTVNNLLDCIKKDREEEKRHYEKAKRR